MLPHLAGISQVLSVLKILWVPLTLEVPYFLVFLVFLPYQGLPEVLMVPVILGFLANPQVLGVLAVLAVLVVLYDWICYFHGLHSHFHLHHHCHYYYHYHCPVHYHCHFHYHCHLHYHYHFHYHNHLHYLLIFFYCLYPLSHWEVGNLLCLHHQLQFVI